MVVNVAGRWMESNAEQPSKKLTGSVFWVTGRLMYLSEEQYWNAYIPSDLTDGGNTIVSSRLMFLQIYHGTVSTWSPKVKEVTLELVL